MCASVPCLLCVCCRVSNSVCARARGCVCVRVRVRVCFSVVQAVGTGADASVAKEYAAEDLDLFDFHLTQQEIDSITQ